MRRATWTILLALPWAGCSAPVKIDSGMSALRVKIIAEPKSGYRAPQQRNYASDGGYYSTYRSAEAPGKGTQFEQVNYKALDDLIVWLEPQNGASQPSIPAAIKVPITSTARALSPPIYACGIGAPIVFTNRTSRGESVYSFSEPNSFDLGKIGPNQKATYAPRAPGPIEILTDSSDDPVAIVYVAPTHHVQHVTSGQITLFNNLRPGRYRASCWHPRLPGTSSDVLLTVDQLTETALRVSVNQLPQMR